VPDPPLRIGELARRTGVTPDTLRKWERRYGLLRPVRTAGGLRIYSSDDERRVHAMVRLRERGVAAADAAATLRLQAETTAARPSATDTAAAVLVDTLTRYDAAAAQRLLDDAFGRLTLRGTCQQVILPALRLIGERWQTGALTIAQEHFASSLIRERLVGAARGWSSGDGRHALLASGAGDRHDIGLICFGAALHQHAWRITFLGADTPTGTIVGAAARLAPTIVVIAVTTAPLAADAALAGLAASTRLFLAGPAVSQQYAEAAGATLLDGDPISAADQVTQLVA
jgi:MerR family transcriptional regulator, light-induced transcriptional regulator